MSMIICKNAKNNGEDVGGVDFVQYSEMILVEKCSRRFIMDLGKRLKAKRKEKNISAEYLAKELGISVSTVYRYEDSSILKIPVSTFEKMCDILGTTPAQMMGNVPEKTVDIKSGNDLPVNFDNPKDAMEFLLKLPTVAAYGGYDPSKMDDETMVAFANEILQQLQLVSYKYR